MWALSLSQGPAAGRAAHWPPATLLMNSSFVFFLWVGRAFHAALGGPKPGHPGAHLSARRQSRTITLCSTSRRTDGQHPADHRSDVPSEHCPAAGRRRLLRRLRRPDIV